MTPQAHSKCISAFTHKDLDGAVSLLVLLWALPDSCINYKSITNLQIPTLISDIKSVNKQWSTYILDLSLRKEFLPDLDQEHITFFDHHESSLLYIKLNLKTD